MDEKVMGNTTVHKFGLLQCLCLLPFAKALHLWGGCFSVLYSCYGISSKEFLNRNLGFTKYCAQRLCSENDKGA